MFPGEQSHTRTTIPENKKVLMNIIKYVNTSINMYNYRLKYYILQENIYALGTHICNNCLHLKRCIQVIIKVEPYGLHLISSFTSGR